MLPQAAHRRLEEEEEAATKPAAELHPLHQPLTTCRRQWTARMVSRRVASPRSVPPGEAAAVVMGVGMGRVPVEVRRVARPRSAPPGEAAVGVGRLWWQLMWSVAGVAPPVLSAPTKHPPTPRSLPHIHTVHAQKRPSAFCGSDGRFSCHPPPHHPIPSFAPPGARMTLWTLLL